MLDDKELGRTTVDLTDFRSVHDKHQASLSEILDNYVVLVDDYKRMRSDLEEERDAREKYKQMARGKDRNPFVLVLIDGDNCIFDDGLVSKGAEGGQKAAILLQRTIEESLKARGLDHCQIIVRVYANLAGLSRNLSRARLVGAEKRSLAPFVAGFNSTNDLFDFVDAGESRQLADTKIKAVFRQFAETAQCWHIYFAGCHDTGYLSELQSYAGKRDRITLVRTTAFRDEFNRLGLRTQEFPDLFRSLPLEGVPPILPSQNKTIVEKDVNSAKGPPAESTKSICSFFLKGNCKYGKQCHGLHTKPTGNAHSATSWRQKSSNSHKATSPSLKSRTVVDEDGSTSGDDDAVDPVQVQIYLSSNLPQAESIPVGRIPVNKAEHRLDAYIPPPSTEERHAFFARVGIKKLCNNYHILHKCPNGDNCEYDHEPISNATLNCLKQITQNVPCPRKGDCRSLNCIQGHICQRADCKWRSGRILCKFGPLVHRQDLKFMRFVDGVGRRAKQDDISSPDPSSAEICEWVTEIENVRIEEEVPPLLDFETDSPIDEVVW